ncbi:MAG: hypothetical protein ABW110_21235 [Steroidobacteraceae bacterium]
MTRTAQSSTSRLILLELNELCPVLVDQFMAEGILPNFKRLRERSQAYVTGTSEDVLEPWIQWVTVHTGVPLAEHGVVDLDEAEKLAHDTFWDRMHNDNVLLLSPMNVKFKRHDASIFMPDPWAASQRPSEDIAPLYEFVRAAVTGHARADTLPAKQALRAVAFLLRHGLSASSALGASRQVLREVLQGSDAKWRRATLLDRLLWDVFRYYWKSARRPRVGVFFSNATAHYQHKYWRHHDPDAFTLKPPAAELALYKDAIRFGYRAHDRLIGKALDLMGEHTSLALCTALSQQPMNDYEARGGKEMFVAKDLGGLLAALSVPVARVEHIMAEESRLHFESAEVGARALQTIAAARTTSGEPVFKTRGFDGTSLIIGCALFASEVDANTMILTGQSRLTFQEQFIRMPTTTSAKHHPDGIFWLAVPNAPASESTARLPLTEVRSKFEEVLGLKTAPVVVARAMAAQAR